jgi:dihydroorotase
MNEGAIASRLGLAGIPAAAEVVMVERDLRLLALTAGGRLHVAHVSTGAAIDAVRAAKARGLRVTCDASPHHLLLNELEVEGYRTYAKVRPPLRAEEDRRALVEALCDGTIDAVASDHNPQDQDSKRLPFAQAEPGVIGVETMLPVLLTLHHEGTIGLQASCAP